MSSQPLTHPMTHPTVNALATRELYRAGQIAYRNRWLLWFCALGLGLCFWYAVPYTFPLQLDPDPLKAASNEATSFQGSLSRQIAVPLILLISGYGLYRLPRRGILRRSRLLITSLGYVGWAMASAAWSTDGAISRKRLIVFLINIVFVYALARLASVEQIAIFGFGCTGIVALISLWADAVTLHSFAPLNPDYRFMGVMTANYQAINLFVCLVCGLTLLQHRPRLAGWVAGPLLLFSVLLFLTRARIGTFLYVAAVVFVGLRMARVHVTRHMRALLLLVLLTVSVPLTILVAGQNGAGALTSVFMMGRKDTENTANLSNRAPLWSELLDSVEDRPLLGFGFDAFWSPERVERISVHQGWVVPHAHNSYLDQTLSLGLPGSLLYAATLLGSCGVAWRRYRRKPDAVHLMPALLLSWIALLGVTESIPVAPNLPTLLAYSCVVKMLLAEGSEEPSAPPERVTSDPRTRRNPSSSAQSVHQTLQVHP